MSVIRFAVRLVLLIAAGVVLFAIAAAVAPVSAVVLAVLLRRSRDRVLAPPLRGPAPGHPDLYMVLSDDERAVWEQIEASPLGEVS